MRLQTDLFTIRLVRPRERERESLRRYVFQYIKKKLVRNLVKRVFQVNLEYCNYTIMNSGRNRTPARLRFRGCCLFFCFIFVHKVFHVVTRSSSCCSNAGADAVSPLVAEGTTLAAPTARQYREYVACRAAPEAGGGYAQGQPRAPFQRQAKAGAAGGQG